MLSGAERLAEPRPEWFDDATCANEGIPNEVFYPSQGDEVMTAQRICARCPVRDECLDHALRHAESYGVWGGKSERERRRILARRRRPR